MHYIHFTHNVISISTEAKHLSFAIKTLDLVLSFFTLGRSGTQQKTCFALKISN